MTILEFLTGFISAFDNPLYDYIFGGVLVTLAGSIAYWIGGRLGYSGEIGFWLWLLTAVVVYAVIACIIRFVMWLISIPWWVWLIITGALLTVIVIGIVHRKRKIGQNDITNQSNLLGRNVKGRKRRMGYKNIRLW